MEKDFQTEIISNILKILSIKGINQAELSRRTELDKAVVSKLFGGHSRLTVNALSKIATALDMSVIDIITYPDKYVIVNSGEVEPLEAVLQIRLKKDKKDQVMKLIFGEHCLEILNK